jgi:hypothetical protein
MAFSNFFSQLFNIPIKAAATPHGLITEEELFEILGAVFAFLFFNFDEVTGMKISNGTLAAYKQISELLKLNIAKVSVGGALEASIDKNKKGDNFMHLYGDNLIRRMLKDGNSADSIVIQILLTSAGVGNYSPQVFLLLTSLILVCSDS